jgi:hypothetical protein
MSHRVGMLAEAARAATWELTRMAGRDALRIRAADGPTQISFLSLEERAELEGLLRSGPPTLAHPGLPACTWSEPRQAFVGVAEDGTELTLSDTTRSPDPALLSQLSADHARIRGRLPAILRIAATELQAVARTWNEGRALSGDEITARLRCTSVNLAPGSARVWLSDGGLFAGHAIEVFLDEEGGVKAARIAG